MNNEFENELDITKLKYVLYARKSTDDPQRQVRSIDDQIFECKLLAERFGIKVVETTKETKSAKKPHLRPEFKRMLKGLREGKYDSILSWHPDRLARNMKEGGEVIDMVDEEIIQDLKFVTHHFTNDANGKMILGMAFVLSKQYSDDLSQKVTRGVRRSFWEGKTPTYKYGYIRDDETGYQYPDGGNFELICEAWDMRRDGISLKEITNYLNDNGWVRKTKTTKKQMHMTAQKLSEMFKDPFYYGSILLQADKTTDLRELYDFTPATDEETYSIVQSLSRRRRMPYKSRLQVFYPLKQMVKCAYCGMNMVVGASRGNTKRYLFYRCDKDYCQREKKSIRAKVVFNFSYDFLENGLNLTEKEYQLYLQNMAALNREKRTRLEIQRHSLEAQLTKTTRDLNELALAIPKLRNEDQRVLEINRNKIEELKTKESQLQSEIEDLDLQLGNPERERLSVEQFLNLSKNAATIVKSGSAEIKDTICRLIFLNFTVDNEKVAEYRLKEPFATLLKDRVFLSGRGGET